MKRPLRAVREAGEFWSDGLTVLVADQLEDFDLNEALGEISSERRAKARSYRYERDRRLSVAVYLLLKQALQDAYGIEENPRLAIGSNGKPFLVDYPRIHFNFSHCAKAAACIVSDRPVGIDVEEIAPVDWEVARRVLSAAELDDVRSSDEPNVSFARYWTKKEALVKLTGDGIDDGRLASLLADVRGVSFETSVNRRRGYVLTVCSADPMHGCRFGIMGT